MVAEFGVATGESTVAMSISKSLLDLDTLFLVVYPIQARIQQIQLSLTSWCVSFALWPVHVLSVCAVWRYNY